MKTTIKQTVQQTSAGLFLFNGMLLYWLLLRRTRIDPLLDGFQFFGSKIRKVFARALHLNEETVC